MSSVSEPTRSWREEDGVIYFSVTSDGTTGKDWITRLGMGYLLGRDHATQLLLSSDFKSTTGVTTEIVVLKGVSFQDKDRIMKNIRAEAYKRKLSKPNIEVACLIREKFSDSEIKAMGLWHIVVMHEPVNVYMYKLPDLETAPTLLGLNISPIEERRGSLKAFFGEPGDMRLDSEFGFAFAKP